MMKKALVVATVVGFIANFEMNDISILQEMGYEVHIASNMSDCNNKEKLNKLLCSGVFVHDIKFYRNPFKLGNIKAYKELKELAAKEKFDLLHCHTPVGGVFGRMVGHSTGVRQVIYTAHGFHFFDGAPLKNWVLFYPIEKCLSKWTDILITINKEDYERAKDKFSAKRTLYVPGVGVDTKKFNENRISNYIREEFGISDSQFLFLSVGQLNRNKNHEVIIRALEGLNNVCYMIVGTGELHEYLRKLAIELGVTLMLPGYRMDVAAFYNAADVYVLPSKREGLNMSLMEAMASSLPCLCGNIRGNTDLIDEKGGYIFDLSSVADIRFKINKMISSRSKKVMGMYNREKIQDFDIANVDRIMRKIYRKINCEE